jgi:glutathione S-transferase
VLDHGDFRLYESQAILRYLDRILPGPSAAPADPQAAGRMDQLMNVNDWYLFQGVANVLALQRIVRPRLLGLAADADSIAAAMPRAHAVFDELARQLGDQRFLVGEEISLADVLLAPQLDFLRATPEWAPLTTTNVSLRGWLDRLNARPSMTATTWERVAAIAKVA